MNVQVLGSDYQQDMMGVDWDTAGDVFGKIAEFAAPVIAPLVQQRMSVTQKAVLQQVTGTTSSVPSKPPPPKKTFMEENGTYIMIGGAVLVGAIILMKSRRRTGLAPVAA